MAASPHCPACHGADAKNIGSFEAWRKTAFACDDGRKEIVETGKKVGLDSAADFYECTACGTYYVHPFPPSEKIAAFYKAYYANERYGAKREKKIRRSLRRMQRLKKLSGGGTLLDVGCNLGFAAEAARQAGFQATGIDIDPDSVARAAKEFPGCAFRATPLQDLAKEGAKFDVVYSSEVIEHVTDPREFALNLGRVLKPGGLLYLTTPDAGHPLRPRDFFKWAEVKPPEHLVWLTRKSLRLILENAGFSGFRFQFNFKPGIKAVAKKR